MLRKPLLLTALVALFPLQPLSAQDNPFLPLQILDRAVYPATGNRYLLTSMTTWPAAYDFAIEQGGWLWSVNDAAEMNFVIDRFLPTILQYGRDFVPPPGFPSVSPNDIDIYIGFTDSELYGASEGNWRWVNGDEVTFTNWSAGEPNNVGQDLDPAGEDFGEIWNLSGNRTWNDDNDRGSGLNGFPPTNPPRLPAGGNVAVVELPPIPPALTLQIDPETGFARFVSQVANEVTLHAYTIGSPVGELEPTAWEGTNLSARGIGGPAVAGQRWESIQGSTEQVYEGFLFGGSTIQPAGTLVLGRIMQPFAGGPDPELTIQFASTDPSNPTIFATLDAAIEFASFEIPSFLAADFDGNGSVDGADLVAWENGFGIATGGTRSQGDANADGAVGGIDFLQWQTQFGTTASSQPFAASVPEPGVATCLLVLMGLAAASRGARKW